MKIHLPLHSHEGLETQGPCRFLTIRGKTGLNPQSVNPTVALRTDLHRSPSGTVSLWFSPLEDLGTMPDNGFIQSRDPSAQWYPLLSDARPARDIENALFGIWWNSGWYPKLAAKFCWGTIWPPMDFVYLPWVYADALPLRRGSWYHIVLTWDFPEQKLRLYVNGFLAAHTDRVAHYDQGGDVLQLGNPAFVVSDFLMETGSCWTQQQVQTVYERGAREGLVSADAESDCAKCFSLVELPELEIQRDRSWTESLARSFTMPGDHQDWLRQGPQYQQLPRCEITSEGLLIQTPEELALDTRTYLWSPKCFEGDIWIEYDFRPESDRGLALLVACASGPQREDYFADHGLPKTGAMVTIIGDRLRNYHWEYFRRVEAMRTDFETQALFKNPWQRPLGYACHPRLSVGEWHRLRFVKTGCRIHGSIDGRTVFDTNDNSWSGTGPDFDFGRMAFRQMYHTKICYRDLSVHNRPSSV